MTVDWDCEPDLEWESKRQHLEDRLVQAAKDLLDYNLTPTLEVDFNLTIHYRLKIEPVFDNTLDPKSFDGENQ